MKSHGLARIGRDAEIRYTANGDAVANVSLAFSFGKPDQHGKRRTQWVDASLWGKRAESLAPFLTQGQQIVAYLEDVCIETYQGKNGEGHKMVGRLADLELVSNKNAEPRQEPRQDPRPTRRQPAMEEMEDDIPF